MGNLSDECDKKIDVALKRKELEKKYGGIIGPADNLPPEIESEWLDHIEQFEQQFEKANRISVWDYIGKPLYRKIGEIEQGKISRELKKIEDCLNEHNIALDTLCEVDEKELYRFIT